MKKFLACLSLALGLLAAPFAAKAQTVAPTPINGPYNASGVWGFQTNVGIAGPRPWIDVTAPPYNASGSAQTTVGNCNGTKSVALTSGPIDFVNGQGIALFGCGPQSSLSAPTGGSVAQITNIPAIALASGSIITNVATIDGATCSGTTATITTIGWHGLTTGESVTIANVQNTSGSLLSAYNITATVTVVNQYQFTYTIGSCPGSGGSYSSANQATITLNSGSTTYNYKIIAVDANNGSSAASSAVTITTANPPVAMQPQVGLKLTWNYVTGATMYMVYRSVGAGAYACVGPANQPGVSTVNPYFRDFGQTRDECAPNIPTTPPTSATNQILVTTIVSGAGTTTLQLATAATPSVSGVTIEHDDTAAILAATNAATNVIFGTVFGGGRVVIPNGWYNVQSLSFPSANSPYYDSMYVQLDGVLSGRQPVVFNVVRNYRLSGGSGGPSTMSANAYPQASIQSPGVSPVVLLRSTFNVALDNISIPYADGDGILADVTATQPLSSVLLNNVTSATYSPGAYAFDCRRYGLTNNSNYNYNFDRGSYIVINGQGTPAMNFEACTQISSKQVNLIAGGAWFEYGGISPNGYVNWDSSGAFPESIAGPHFTFNGGPFQDVTIVHFEPADTPNGTEQYNVKVNSNATLYGLELTGNAGVIRTEGPIFGFIEHCTYINTATGCTGLPSQTASGPPDLAQQSGTYFDNNGGMFSLGPIGTPLPSVGPPFTPTCITFGNCATYSRLTDTITDNFARGTQSTLGRNWQFSSGTSAFGITGNAASSSGGGAFYTGSSSLIAPPVVWSPSQSSSITYGSGIGAAAVLGNAGTSSATSDYELYCGSGTLYLFKIVSGSSTTLASESHSCTNGDVYELDSYVNAAATSTTLVAYLNGTIQPTLTYTDSSSPWTSGTPGMYTTGTVLSWTGKNLSPDFKKATQYWPQEQIFAGGILPGTYTVATLPSASSNPGVVATVTDSTSISAEGQTCVGSSSNNALVFSNGTVWKCF